MTPTTTTEFAHPNRHERRRAWALVPRAVRDQAPPRRLDWLTGAARRVLNRDLQARNDLDRALAAARGLAADDPRCARFQGAERQDQLDRIVRARRRAGLVPAPAGAMAVATAEGLGVR